jgi:LPS export ABC transporter protein LptC
MKHIVILSFAIILLLNNSCENASEKQVVFDSTFVKSADSPDQIFKMFEVFFYDSSYKKAKLSANYAKMFFRSKRTLVDTNVYCEFYDKDGISISSVLKSDSAIVEDDTKNMFAYGNVKVNSDSTKTKLTTQLLQWDNARQLLLTDKFVRIESPYEIIEGYGFESNLNLSNYKIFKVSGQIIK